MPAVALTDQSNLFGLVKFYKKAISSGIKPVIGVDIKIANADEIDRPNSMLLLCQDLDGYRNLTKLVTRSYLEGQHRSVPMAHPEWLNRDSMKGLIALSGAMGGDVGRALAADHTALAERQLQHWQTIFDDRFYLELTRTGHAGEEDVLQQTLTSAAENAVPVVATNDVRFLHEADFNAHEARVYAAKRNRNLRVITGDKRHFDFTKADFAFEADQADKKLATSLEVEPEFTIDAASVILKHKGKNLRLPILL